MPPVNDATETISDIVTEVGNNLFDAGMQFFTQQDILDCCQDCYNRIFTILAPLEYSTLLAQSPSPYYDLAALISNFMYVSAVYNPQTLLWLEGTTYEQFKSEYQTYIMKGEPRFINIASMRRVIMFPYNPSANGTTYLYVIFKAIAPTITLAHVPQLPFSVGPTVLEYMTMATCLEQRREWKKAGKWWAKIYEPGPDGKKPLWAQLEQECSNLAKIDRPNVLEPYRWIFHGGVFSTGTQITNETPTGTVDGTNTIFEIANVPAQTTSLVFKIGGVTQVLGVDYTFNGQSIYCNTAPAALSVLTASYLY